MSDNEDSAREPSVTRWLSDLKQGDDSAARQLWELYFERLTRVARRRMGSASRRDYDEEDVALSVFDVLCRGALDGRFQALTTRDELWRLLVTVTAQKVVDHLRRQVREKRGGGRLRGHSVTLREGLPDEGFDIFQGDDPSPEFLAMLEERRQQLLARLRNDMLRKIATMRMAGCSNQEIADSLGISIRSVERKLSLIRQEWSDAVEDQLS